MPSDREAVAWKFKAAMGGANKRCCGQHPSLGQASVVMEKNSLAFFYLNPFSLSLFNVKK